MPYGGLFGFGGRLIALPVEKVAMLGANVAAVDLTRADFEMTPTWYSAADQALGPDETVRVQADPALKARRACRERRRRLTWWHDQHDG